MKAHTPNLGRRCGQAVALATFIFGAAPAGAQVLPEGTLTQATRPPEARPPHGDPGTPAHGDPGAPTPGQPGAPITDQGAARVQILHWFRGFEFVPGPRQFATIDATVLGPALVDIVRDAALHPVMRAQAVSALVHAPAAVSEPILVDLIEQPSHEPVLRRKAALVLADAFGSRHLDALVSAYIEARTDLRLREAIAQALRQMGPEAHAAREQLWRGETEPSVRYWLSGTKNVQPGRPR